MTAKTNAKKGLRKTTKENKMNVINVICKEISPKKYAGILCSTGGFPIHNGNLLARNYNTLEKVNTLLSQGNIFSLSKTTPSKRSDTPKHQMLRLFTPNSARCLYNAEYMYVYGIDGVWRFCALFGDDRTFQPVLPTYSTLRHSAHQSLGLT